MKKDDLLTGLPGESLMRQGLADFHGGHSSIPSFLIGIARTRLSQAGLISTSNQTAIPEPELQLYRALTKEGGDAYSRYNALLRDLISFENALEKRIRVEGRTLRVKN